MTGSPRTAADCGWSADEAADGPFGEGLTGSLGERLRSYFDEQAGPAMPDYLTRLTRKLELALEAADAAERRVA